MTYKLIMLPQPILVSDEERLESDKVFDGYNLIKNYRDTWGEPCFKKIIAGIEGLPKLGFSESVADILANECGWVDVEKLALQKYPMFEDIEADNWGKEYKSRNGFIEGFKLSQSLNEKKYSEEDMIEFAKFCLDYNNLLSVVNLSNLWNIDSQKAIRLWLQKRKPKEYQVQYTQEGNTIKVTKIL